MVELPESLFPAWPLTDRSARNATLPSDPEAA
eukprot:CAMPEP_0119074578 /NCGR_PEP_ID=MMETSP1178-20130426/72199_1 /TAXON_ID=33656 /ORGANISM="unid sp, Strain CCMP2000" /LENGTH=31 /DNA_ID= /DNA_START= /DNA_END= /DNA_ORIENTATION=